MAPSRRLVVDHWAQTGGRGLGEAPLRPGGWFSLRGKTPSSIAPQGDRSRAGKEDGAVLGSEGVGALKTGVFVERRGASSPSSSGAERGLRRRWDLGQASDRRTKGGGAVEKSENLVRLTGIPAFRKFALHRFTFMEDLHYFH